MTIDIFPKQITYSEENLVCALKQQDSEAFEYLYDLYSGVFYGYLINNYCKSNHAEDVLSEVFQFAWFEIALFDPRKHRLFTWMLRHLQKECDRRIMIKKYFHKPKISENRKTRFVGKFIDNLLSQRVDLKMRN